MKYLPVSSSLFLLLATFYAVTAGPSIDPARSSGYTTSTRDYDSSAIIEFIVPRMDDVPQEQQRQVGREYMEKQRGEILSDENLQQAIQELMPGAFDAIRQSFFDSARSQLKVEFIKGTDLVRITVRSRDKQLSCDLANRLAERYLRNHKPKNGAKGPIIHEKAKIGVPVEKKIPDVEQPGAAQSATQPADKLPVKDQPSTPTSKDAPPGSRMAGPTR